MQRAADHFCARSLRLARVGAQADFHPEIARRAPELYKHARWLVRYLLFSETPTAIARSAGLRGPDQRMTVEKAIRELARLIRLPLPRRPVGRPRKRPLQSKLRST
jgi:hypothetical protein